MIDIFFVKNKMKNAKNSKSFTIVKFSFYFCKQHNRIREPLKKLAFLKVVFFWGGGGGGEGSIWPLSSTLTSPNLYILRKVHPISVKKTI